ncbi:MAG: thermonuclease family protein, partial [Alphaproteobacteria bacterium]
MLLRLTLWALFIGSVIMGFFGYQTGSATTTVIGMMAMIFIAFLLFFLIKMSLQAGLMFVKIVIIVLLVGGIILLAVRGISYLWNTGKQTAQKAVEQSVQIPGKIQNPSFFSTVSSFLSGDKTPTVIPLKEDKNKSVTPKKTQKIVGTVTAVTNGTTFSIGERSIRLYGIDAPALSQTCLDLRGQSYKCGLSAKQKLGKLLLNKIID